MCHTMLHEAEGTKVKEDQVLALEGDSPVRERTRIVSLNNAGQECGVRGELQWPLELSQLDGGLGQTLYLLWASTSLLCKMTDFNQRMPKGGQNLQCGSQSGPKTH